MKKVSIRQIAKSFFWAKQKGFTFLALLLCLGSPKVIALDNNTALRLNTFNGWQAMELWTQTDDISGVQAAGHVVRGKFDGLGAFLTGADELTVLINHEVADDAAISRVILSASSLRQAVESKRDGGATPFPSGIVQLIDFSYAAIYDGSYHAVNSPNPVATGNAAVDTYSSANFTRFCSGTSYAQHGFGFGRGFTDNLYLTGEESFDFLGRFYVYDPYTRNLWEAPDLGGASWENAALVDSGVTSHVALLLQADNSTPSGDFIRLYIGQKHIDANGDGEIDFLERNGLRGGTIYQFIPEAGASAVDLPDGQVDGLWSTSTTGALVESKLEDIHANPNDGTKAIFAAQNDGIYRMELTFSFAGDSLDLANSPVSIIQIDDDDVEPISAPDNLTWSPDGKIYVQEDGGGNEVFQLNPDGSGRVQMTQNNDEPSGIFDVSALLGYEAGGVFLSSNLSGTQSQLNVLISPSITSSQSLPFVMDGILDSSGYQLKSPGMTVNAAIRGDTLYLSTWTPNPTNGNDHFILLSDSILGSAKTPAEWGKAGTTAFPANSIYLASEATNDWIGWFNTGTAAVRAFRSPVDGEQMEASINLTEAFGTMPTMLYLSSVAYEDPDNGLLAAQAPDGNGDGNIHPDEVLSIPIEALIDGDSDGTLDRLDPAKSFQICDIQRTGATEFNVLWNSVPCQNYHIEESSNLVSWAAIAGTNIEAPNGSLTTNQTFTSSPTRNFFRVVLD